MFVYFLYFPQTIKFSKNVCFFCWYAKNITWFFVAYFWYVWEIDGVEANLGFSIKFTLFYTIFELTHMCFFINFGLSHIGYKLLIISDIWNNTIKIFLWKWQNLSCFIFYGIRLIYKWITYKTSFLDLKKWFYLLFFKEHLYFND